ncbi:MAG: metallophosphoesterase [Candidatus Hydrogenedentes bacterium]|nr:metallophosphoesterase [Candidatus Hydrogenedentota bacterium]
MHGSSAPIDTLLHVADLHFWKVVANPLRLFNKRFLGNLNVWLRRGRSFPMSEAALFVEALAATSANQLLLTGDFTSTSLDEEFLLARRFVDALNGSGFALNLMPGNHDVYTFEARRNHRFERHFAPYVPQEGYPALRRLAGGTPLLLVPTVCPNWVSSKGRITRQEAEQVKRLLDGLPPVVIVAGHYPLLEKTHGYELTRERRLRNADALRQVLGESGRTILYVAGHVHRFSYTRDPVYPNLSHLSTGAFFHINRREHIRGEFARICVLADGFEVHRHTLSESWSDLEVPPEAL